MQIDFETMP
jgi:hypothetical protein